MYNPLAQVIIQNSDNTEVLRIGYGTKLPLLSLSWTLEVNENGSSCQFDIPLYKDVLDLLLKVKAYEPVTKSDNTPTEQKLEGNSTDAKNTSEHIKLIVDECKRQGITNKQQIAYILATADHESNFVNFTEFATGDAYEGRGDLGNVQAGDGRRFKGRGYVQLTGRSNYQKYSRITGQNLVANPDLVSKQPTRSFILVHGMKTGSFTGVGLSDFTSSSGSVDYYNARAIINGDKGLNGSSIAAKARAYENNPYVTSVTSANTVSTEQQSKTVSQANTTPVANQPSYKILIRVGELGALFVEYVYLISEVNVNISDNPSISVQGVTPLWAINTYKQTETKSNLTLKQLAQQTAKKGNLSLEFSGKGTEILHLENNGLTDYQLLLRECLKAGYVLSHEGTKLIVKPMREGKRYQLESEEIISFTSSIKPSSPLPQSSGGIRGSWTAKPSLKSDVKTGTVQSSNTSQNRPNRTSLGNESKTTGKVTLEDGKQVTESQAQSEVARIQDLPSRVTFIPKSADLLLSPTDMLRINGLSKYSDRLSLVDWYISSVSFSYGDDGLTMELGLYQPGIEVKVNQQLAGNTSNTNTTEVSNTSGFGLPVNTPYVFECSNGFGMRGGRMHNGIDITGVIGDDNVYASKEGTIIKVVKGCVVGDYDCGGGYGNFIEIRHADGYETLYAHLSASKVNVGDKVQRKQLIGIVGNTGGSRGTHLHFEIRKNNSLINPAPLVGAKCT